MVIWFAILAPVLVAEVFRSPLVDYRLVAFGAVLPSFMAIFSAPPILHTLAAPVTVLTVVMLATVGRRLLRRRLLGVPIGMFLHLVLDGSWSTTSLFWWPVFGAEFEELSVLETAPILLRVGADLIALLLIVPLARRYGLTTSENRMRLAKTGHLQRQFLS